MGSRGRLCGGVQARERSDEGLWVNHSSAEHQGSAVKRGLSHLSYLYAEALAADLNDRLCSLHVQFMVDLSLPMKGLGNDVEKRDLFSFAISSPDPSLTEGSPPGFELFPPGYLESTGKDDDFDDDKK